MPRPLWKGHLSFGLVMIPCTLISGESSQAGLDLDMLDARDKQRIRFKRVNEKTGAEVPWSSIVKGYEYDDGKYVVLTPDDFKRAGQGVTRGAEIIDFVDRDSISPVYYEKPYYLQPSKGGEKGYVLLRDALRHSDVVGIAHLVLQTRMRLAALMVIEDVLTLITMRWPEEVRPADEVDAPRGSSTRAKASPRELQMAEQLLKGMHTDWDPDRYHDEYHKALRKFIAQKAKTGGKGKAAAAPVEEDIPDTYNIMELLKKSVEGHSRSAKSSHKRTTKRKAG